MKIIAIHDTLALGAASAMKNKIFISIPARLIVYKFYSRLKDGGRGFGW